MTVTSDSFPGLAFPVVKVRFVGATDIKGARWVATCQDTRVIRSYNHDKPSGADNARATAEACFAKRRAGYGNDEPYVAIPGDLSSNEYVFTFVPAELLS